LNEHLAGKRALRAVRRRLTGVAEIIYCAPSRPNAGVICHLGGIRRPRTGALCFLAWSKSQKERYISGRSGWLCAHCFSPCTKVCVLSCCDNATMVRVGVPDGAVTEYRLYKKFFWPRCRRSATVHIGTALVPHWSLLLFNATSNYIAGVGC